MRIMSTLKEEDGGVAGEGEATLDGGWELPELASLALLLCIFLLSIGGAASGWLYWSELRNQQVPPFSGLGWTALQFGTRVITPTTAALLLGALAAAWWQYTQWTSISHSDADDFAAALHVQRIRSLTLWITVGFVVMLLTALAFSIATIASNAGNHLGGEEWASDVGAVTESLAIVIIAGLGFVAARRLLTAATAYLSQNY